MRASDRLVPPSVRDPGPELFGERHVFAPGSDGAIYMVTLNSMPPALPRIGYPVQAIRFCVDDNYHREERRDG